MRFAVGLCFAATILISVGCSKGNNEPSTEDHIARLEQHVEQQMRATAEAVDHYAPKVAGRLDD
jgi:hypothetical protein